MLNISVLWAIAEINATGKSARPKNLLNETGYSRASIYRAIKELRDAKMIRRYGHGKYVVNIESPIHQSLNDAVKVIDEQRCLW